MNVNSFIEDQLTTPVLARLPMLFREGHKLAQQVIRDNPCLRVDSFQVGDVRSAAIEFTVDSFIKAKNYPGIISGFCSFSRPTGKFFQIQTVEARVTINHVPHPKDFPRRAEFRKQARRGNAPYLFADLEKERIRQEAEEESLFLKKHLLITYGNRDLEFLQIGALRPGESQEWVQPPMDLLGRHHLIVDNIDDDLEGKAVTISMEVKDQFIQHLSENARS